jgi:hypothetical protein
MMSANDVAVVENARVLAMARRPAQHPARDVRLQAPQVLS